MTFCGAGLTTMVRRYPMAPFGHGVTDFGKGEEWRSTMMGLGDVVALDDPVGESLRGHHGHLARRLGGAVTYLSGVATFSAISAEADSAGWGDLARLLGRGEFADMFSCPAMPPSDWEPVFVLEGRQMIWKWRQPSGCLSGRARPRRGPAGRWERARDARPRRADPAGTVLATHP